MKRKSFAIAICAGGFIFASGCGRTDHTPPPAAAPQTPTTQEAQSAAMPSAAPPARPPADPPKNDTQAPKPGEAGDHSNPEFKAGGKKDPQ
jgi:hypothetical protein